MLRRLSIFMSFFIALLPTINDVASAQNTQEVIKQIDVSTASVSTGATTSVGAHSGHFELYKNADGKIGVRGIVKANDRAASFDLTEGKLVLGDGYTISAEKLADTPAERSKKLTAEAPDGRRAVAVVRSNRNTLETSATGLDKVTALAGESGHGSVLAAALPLLIASLQKPVTNTSTPAGTISTSTSPSRVRPFSITAEGDVTADWIKCFLLSLVYIAATLDLIFACGVPEPVEPIACGAAIIGFVAAGEAVAEACAGV
jgi:hypothetical protein